MENKENDIEKLFRERFSKDEATVSPAVWENIKNSLPPEPTKDIHNFPNTLLLSLIACVCIGTLLAGGYYFLKPYSAKVSFLSAAPTTSSNKQHVESRNPSTFCHNTDPTKQRNTEIALQPDAVNSYAQSIVSYTNKESLSQQSSVEKDEREIKLKTSRKEIIYKDKEVVKESSLATKVSLYSNEQSTANKSNRSNSSISKNDGAETNNKFHAVTMSNEGSAAHEEAPSQEKIIVLNDAKENLKRESSDGSEEQTSSEVLHPDSSSSNVGNVLYNEDRLHNGYYTEVAKSMSGKEVTDSLPEAVVFKAMNDEKEAESLSSFEAQKNSSTDSSSSDSDKQVKKLKEEKPKLDFRSRISVDIFATTLLTGAVTRATDATYEADVAEKNKKDSPDFGYYAGFHLNYQLNDRFSLSTGVAYSSFQEHYNFKRWDSNAEDNKVTVRDQYHLLSIPLHVSYTFYAREKIALAVAPGVQGNIFLGGVTYLPNANRSDVEAKRSGFNSISFGYILAFEGSYRLGEHASLLLRPVFMYGATSLHSKASSLKQTPYGAGLSVGFRFKF